MSSGDDRLARYLPGELTPEQGELYRRITGGPRAAGSQAFPLTDENGSLNGPFNAMLASPAVGTALQELGSALRYRSNLTVRVRELAILMVAAHWDSAFERHAHEAVGRAAGLTEAALAQVRAGGVPDDLTAGEACALAVVAELLHDGDLSDAVHQRARTDLGDAAVFELTALVGYYATLALQLRVYRVGAPAEPVDTANETG